MRGYKYDAGSDVEGIFPEEFRKYLRHQNLFCRHINSCWFFRNKHESDEGDRDFADKIDIINNYTCLFHITGTGQCLVQFWGAQEVTSIGDFGERRFRLTSHSQPFIFIRRRDDKTPFSEGICSYRMKMVDFITGDEGEGGVIGRVFRNNRMEFTPNIGYYSYEEYSDRDLAISCHIKSSIVFPLSDSSGRSIGVVDIVSWVELNVVGYCFRRILLDFSGYSDCCKDICEQYDSIELAVSEIKEVMQLVSRSCCLVCAQTWMLCNRCSCLSTCQRLHNDLRDWSDLLTLKKGEGFVGKAASSHNLVYCDDVSQFSITEYPLAHFVRSHKLTACFATCLRSNRTGNQIYVLEFFLNPSKVNGKGPKAMLVPILEGMRKKFQTFKLASGEEIGGNLSVQVIDAGSPDKFKILEIGKLDSVENNTFEMDLIHNYVNVVNTIEEGVTIAPLDKQHNNATISSIGVINSNISLQPLVESNVIHTEKNVASALEEYTINSSKLPARRGRNAIDISLEELKEVSGMNRKDAAKKLEVSVSTFKRVCRDYQIPRWPPRKKNLDQSHSGNSAQAGSMKEFGGSAPIVQNASLVTIKTIYGDNFIKFKLSACSGINVFNQQVSNRLELEPGSYIIKYQDDDNDRILIQCDDDLQDYISTSTSLGKTTLTMLLERI